MRIVLVAIFCCLSFMIHAGDPKYPVSDIPADLLKDVDVVIREDQMLFRIHSKSKASYHVYQVITILNANGKRFAKEVVGYDKLSKVTSLKGNVYDALGKPVSKLKSNEIYDQSAYDGFSLYSDNRFKSIDLSQGTYPYTVEIDYEVELKYLFYIPRFYVLPGQKVSVQHSLYKLTFPPDLSPRYKARNVKEEPKHETLPDGMESLTWTFNNVLPIKVEQFSPPMQDILPNIAAAPTAFEYDGYAGSMNSWNEFGQWINSLNKDRGILPEPTKQKIKLLTKDATSMEEKVHLLYEYMQSKTRYVSIQLGIGGFQPFEAITVDQTGYGDCKALSNYMVAMLKEVGVKAHYTLIRAGDDVGMLDESFPSSQFNHAIVSVPNGKDTIWLECTSQTNPFDYQGTFTGDRKALAVTDNGAKVVNTHYYTAEQNVQSRTADVYVDANGDATAKVRTTYSGIQYENDNIHFILGNQYDEQKKWLQQNIEIPAFDIKSFSMENRKDKIPSAIVKVDLVLKRYVTVSGKRLFLTPNLMNKSTLVPEKNESRKNDIVLKVAYTDLDTIRYHLPEEIYPEFLPEPVSIKSAFGEYEAKYTIDQGSVVYIRRIKRNKGQFQPEKYTNLIDFYKSINKADNTKLVFLNKT